MSIEPNGSRPDLGLDLDVVVVGAGFAGLYASYMLREKGLAFQVLEAARGSRVAPGTGTAIRGHAATSRALTTRTPSPTRSTRSGNGANGMRRSPRSCAMRNS